MIDLHDAAERDAAAGEYVLGTLADADRAGFEAALAGDGGLREAVYAWQDRLLGLSARAAPAEPRPQLWQRIAVALDIPKAGAGSAPTPVPRPVAPKPRWWQRPGPWQGLGGMATAAALVMALLLVGPWRAAPAERYLALLQSPDGRSTGWVVEVETGHDVRLVPVAAGAEVPAGRALQFWTKPEGAAGPTSLGLVRAGAPLVLPVSRLPGVGERQLFEITLEPEAGSPLGRPTGPILYVGRTLRL